MAGEQMADVERIEALESKCALLSVALQKGVQENLIYWLALEEIGKLIKRSGEPLEEIGRIVRRSLEPKSLRSLGEE